MSNLIKGFTVVLEHDIKEDDARSLLYAISMIKGVLEVTQVKTYGSDYIKEMQIKNELRQKLFDVLK